jgi:hypothetical protein
LPIRSSSEDPIDEFLVSKYLASLPSPRILGALSTENPAPGKPTKDFIDFSFGERGFSVFRRGVQKSVAEFPHVDLATVILIKGS